MAGKFFEKLVSGLTKTRNNIVSGLNSIFTGFSNIDDDFYEELEETLIMSDIGVNTTEEILDTLKEQVKELKIKEPMECKDCLLYTSDAADDLLCVDLGGCRIINKKTKLDQISSIAVSKTKIEKDIKT